MITKRHYILYPFFLACYSVLMPLGVNRIQISPALAIRPFVIVFMVTALVLIVFKYILKDWELAGLLSFVLMILIWFSGYLDRLGDRFTLIKPLLIVILVFLVVLFANIYKKKAVWMKLCAKFHITPFLNIVTGVLLLLPFYLLILSLIDFAGYKTTFQQSNIDNGLKPILSTNTDKPDIYYIILDGYGRADMLQEIYGFDDADFLDFLTRNNFYVARQSRSNYIQTALSLASSLNMDYLNDYVAPLGTDSHNRFPLERLIKNSRVVSLLKEQGYQILAFQTAYVSTDLASADVYLTPYVSINHFEGLLLANSIFKWLIKENSNIPIFGYGSHRRLIRYTLNELTRVPESASPKFVFAHILAPHPPFVFDQYGADLTPDYPYAIFDASHFPDSQATYIEGYVNQTLFLNSNLEKIITAILEGSKKPPVIIIQGDHGPGALLDWNNRQYSCLAERTSILNAYYFPGHEINQLYPSISPVNTFRVIFDTYFGAQLELFPDKSYFSSVDKPYDFYEVKNSDLQSNSCLVESYP